MKRALTPTLIICFAASITAGIALARPASDPSPATAAPAVVEPATTASGPGRAYGGRSAERPSAGAAPAAPPGAAPNAVAPRASFTDFTFKLPASVAPGAVLTVANGDGAPHTFTARNGEFDTGTIDGRTSAMVTAPGQAGEFSLFCAIHPSMTATLTVA